MKHCFFLVQAVTPIAAVSVCAIARCEVRPTVLRSLSIVSAGRDSGFELLHGRCRRRRCILLTCGGGFPIEEGSVGCPIHHSSLMALLHHLLLPVHRLFSSSSGFCSNCFLQEHPRSRFLVTSKIVMSPPGLSLVYYYYAAFLPVLQRDFRDLCILRVQIDICSSGPSSFLALRAAV